MVSDSERTGTAAVSDQERLTLAYRDQRDKAIGELARANGEIERLRALVTRLTSVAEDLSRETSDPGTEALAAIYCGKNFIYG